MKSSTNIVCLLLAVAGLSFGIGQAVGQDRAEAGGQAARVQSVKDTKVRRELKFIGDGMVDHSVRLAGIDVSLESIADTLGDRSGGKSVRQLLQQICRQGTNLPYTDC